MNWGVPGDLLFYRLGDFRKCMALALPHDVLVRSWQDEFPLTQALWKLADDFGRSEAKFFPYYEHPNLVRGMPAEWIASAYVHPKSGALLILSNLSKQDGTTAVTPNWEMFGLAPDNATAVDGMSRQDIPVFGGSLSVRLPSVGWQTIWIRAGK